MMQATHVLTVNEIPAHDHQQWSYSWKDGGDIVFQAGTNRGLTWAFNDRTKQTGGGVAHNNLPPYLSVYIWKRIK